MNLQYQELNSLANALSVDISVKGKVIAFGVALAIASKLPLPSSAIDDIDNYYGQIVGPLVNGGALSDINESCVFDMKTAIAMVREFWFIRYSAFAMCETLAFAENSTYGFVDTIVGANLHMSPEAHEFANEYKCEIYCVRRKVYLLMQDAEGGIAHG